MNQAHIYPGIDQDHYGDVTPIGRIIRDVQEAQVSREAGTPGAADAWVFQLLPETESCAGWSHDRLQELYDRVAQAWQPYGQLASRLPEDLRARHERIYAEAIERARALGWDAELGDEE